MGLEVVLNIHLHTHEQVSLVALLTTKQLHLSEGGREREGRRKGGEGGGRGRVGGREEREKGEGGKRGGREEGEGG